MSVTAMARRAEPMKEINTTPLIDVMLVLLIMFILVIPPITHKVPVELPPHGPPGSATPPPMRQLEITATGGLRWEGTAITSAQLPARLDAMVADPDRPFLRIVAHGDAPYDRVDHYLAAISHSGVEQLGFVGLHEFAHAF